MKKAVIFLGNLSEFGGKGVRVRGDVASNSKRPLGKRANFRVVLRGFRVASGSSSRRRRLELESSLLSLSAF